MTERQNGLVKIEEGVVFGRGGGRDLRCDVYRPPQPRADGKAVLLVHGGAWFQGDRSQLRGYGVLLGRLGYTCVSTEYRLTGEARWPAQIHDVKACLRFMRSQSGALGIDPDKISISGNSAGGHLSLLIAATPGAPEFEGEGGHPGVETHVEACIAFYAPTVLGTEWTLSGTPPLFEDGASEEVARAASPLTYATRPDLPPTLLLHGDKDELVPVRGSIGLYRALRKAGARAELHVFSDAPHGFDAGRALGRECAALMHLFLERHT